LHIDGNAVFDEFGYDFQAVRRNLVGMDEMGGQFQALFFLLQLEVFHFQVVEQLAVVPQKEVRVIGRRPGGQTQGLDMRNVAETVDGAGHVGPVQKRVPAGDDHLFDAGRPAHVFQSLVDV
jgi:hypothetical protein